MENALIRVYKLNQGEIVYENFFVTNEDGKTVNIPLYAPDIILSLEEENDIRPYETYNVELRLKGYEIEEIQNVQIFADETSYLPMHPAPSRRQVFPGRTVSVITDHHLLQTMAATIRDRPRPTTGEFAEKSSSRLISLFILAVRTAMPKTLQSRFSIISKMLQVRKFIPLGQLKH